MTPRIAPLCALFAAFLWAGAAHAVSVTGGSTTFVFTADFSGNDVTITPTGGATPSGAANTFVVPITGGAVTSDLRVGSLEHQGSGFDFDFGSVTISVEDMRFDLSEGNVPADLSSGGLHSQIEVFNLKRCIDAVSAEVPCTGASGAANEYGLFLRPQAADFFENDVLGDSHFDDDDQIALAIVNPVTAAPEPAALGLLTLGAALLGMAHRRLNAKAL